jgi:hypothetical protein
VWDPVRDCAVVVSYRCSGTAEPTKISNFSERFEAHTMGGLDFFTSRRAALSGNVRHRPKHVATRLTPAGAPETRVELFLPQAPTVQTCVSG